MSHDVVVEHAVSKHVSSTYFWMLSLGFPPLFDYVVSTSIHVALHSKETEPFEHQMCCAFSEIVFKHKLIEGKYLLLNVVIGFCFAWVCYFCKHTFVQQTDPALWMSRCIVCLANYFYTVGRSTKPTSGCGHLSSACSPSNLQIFLVQWITVVWR